MAYPSPPDFLLQSSYSNSKRLKYICIFYTSRFDNYKAFSHTFNSQKKFLKLACFQNSTEFTYSSHLMQAFYA